jgi:hypothetical protein
MRKGQGYSIPDLPPTGTESSGPQI